MRIISWNIRHGGGARVNDIITLLAAQKPDIVIIPEFRNNDNGERIKEALSNIGLSHNAVPNIDPKLNTVLISSRFVFKPSFFKEELGKWEGRILSAEFEDLIIYGVYFPQRNEKAHLFNFILDRAQKQSAKPTLFIGDFNTGKHLIDEERSTFYCSDYLDKMEEYGLKDCWRHQNGNKREYTWYSNSGNGFRIDHSFGNDLFIENMKNCYYDHEPRMKRISDHSMMILETKRGI